eukprot:TRINITY_DN7076_c0_g2_i1.p1 TRINITY_DN7076_c0_g2~~TRINITY_DN7076_c0_g2_i1.p1  ORF type:complete len:892 (-),score=292.12 TRINITY_DN7076_c0_g2_i1:491-3166(-)
MMNDAEGDALVDWINACYPEAEAEEFDDLADGSILADMLQMFAPGVDSTNAAAGSVKDLHQCLARYFGTRLSLPRLAGNMSGSFCKPALLLALTEAVLLAAVEGPRKDEAINAIMTLEDSKQEALGTALQRLMSAAPPPEPEPSTDTAGSGTPSKRVSYQRSGTSQSVMSSSGGGDEYESEADLLQEEVATLRQRCREEMETAETAERSVQLARSQLQSVMMDLHAEEEQAAETATLISQWQRTYGDDIRRFKEQSRTLRSELAIQTEAADDMPTKQARLQRQIESEMRACTALQDMNGKLEVEIRQAAHVDENDDTSQVKAEMTAATMVQGVVDRKLKKAEQAELEASQAAKSLWESLHQVEVNAQQCEDSLRHLARVAEREEESEADYRGLLEFRESEMNQLMEAMDDAAAEDDSPSTRNSVSPTSSAVRGSIAGRGNFDVQAMLPDLAERRKLFKELSKETRLFSKWQTELNQQQHRHLELDRRIRSLEDESAQLLSSEEHALTEFRQLEDKERRLISEHEEQQPRVDAEVRQAKLEKEQMMKERTTEAQTSAETAQAEQELLAARKDMDKRREARAEQLAKLAKAREAASESQEAPSAAVAMETEATEKSGLEEQEWQGLHRQLKQHLEKTSELQERQAALQGSEQEHQQQLSQLKEAEAAQQQLLKTQEEHTMQQRQEAQQQQLQLQQHQESLVKQQEGMEMKQRALHGVQDELHQLQERRSEQHSEQVRKQQQPQSTQLDQVAKQPDPQPKQQATQLKEQPKQQQSKQPLMQVQQQQQTQSTTGQEPVDSGLKAKPRQTNFATPEQAGTSAAAAARAAGKSLDEQVHAAAKAAMQAAADAGSTTAQQAAASAAAAGAAASLAAKAAGKSVEEQLPERLGSCQRRR